MRNLFVALRLLILMSLCCSVIYTCAVFGVGQSLFTEKANGSLVYKGEQLVGSELIGQYYYHPSYFWPRPSAYIPVYQPKHSGASHLPYGSEFYIETITERYGSMKVAHPDYKGAIPIDMLTSSASGLDPHIGDEAAYMQVHRIAKARKLDSKAVWDLVGDYTEEKQWHVFGARRVNVLMLNLALDELDEEANGR